MKAKIALATVSGKAYYKLVNELKRRNMPFLSLTPTEPIPLDIKVVITTKEEHSLITHSNILIFEDEMDPATIIDEAIRIAQGRPSYERIIIGVDPGKTFGLAVLGDGNILETLTCSSLEETVNIILKTLEKAPVTIKIVKIGDGAPNYTQKLLQLLDEYLPKEIEIEIISEAGTSRFTRESLHRREVRDVMSAIKIAERKGRTFHRRKNQ